jgi:DNA-binding XRE family transcriptional regulator
MTDDITVVILSVDGQTARTIHPAAAAESWLTQARLAARAHVTQGYIAHLETGTRQRLSLEVADRLARALDVAVADLLKWKKR